ncbi:uncharacterized protein LOC143236551 [Tachypleus tridentatus]|uniref:uncharacterized protein LOC143236551 n=1 Tax=Tachypleus tridentatus TaxID=6853 RepID=UPI003FD27371
MLAPPYIYCSLRQGRQVTTGDLPVGRLSSIVHCRGSSSALTMWKMLVLAFLLARLSEIEGKQPDISRRFTNTPSVVMNKTGIYTLNPINSVGVDHIFDDKTDSVVVGNKCSDQRCEKRSAKTRDGLSFKTDRLTVGTLEGLSATETLPNGTNWSSVLTNDSSTAQPIKGLQPSLKNHSKIRFMKNRRIITLQVSPQTQKQTNNQKRNDGSDSGVITSEVNISQFSVTIPYVTVINHKTSDFLNTVPPSLLVSGEAHEDPINGTYTMPPQLVASENKSSSTVKNKTEKMLYQDDNQTEENATEYTVSGEDGSGLDLNYTTYEEEFRVTTSNNVNSGQNQDWLFPGHMQASSLITEAGTLVTEENKTDQSANLREQLKDFESVILSTRSPDLYKSLTADFSELVSPNSEVDLSRDPLKNILNKSKAIEVHNWTRNISFLISVVTSTARQGILYDDRVDDKNPNIRIPEEVLSSKYLADGTRTNQTTHKFNNTTRYDDTHHQKNTERFFNTPPENEYRLRSGLLEDSTSFTDPLKTLNPGSYSTSSPPKNFPNTHNLFIDGATTSPTVRTNNSVLTQDSNIKTKKIPINRTNSLEKDKSLNTTPNPTTTFNDTQQSITTVVRIAGVMKLTKGIQWSPNLRRKDTKYYIRLSHTVKELSERVDKVVRVVDMFFMYTQSERVDKVVRVVDVFFMYTQSERVDKVVRVVDVFFMYTQSERVDNVLRVVDVFFMYTQSERVDKVVRVDDVFFMYTQSERVDKVVRVVDVFFMYTQSECVDKVVTVIRVFFMYTQSECVDKVVRVDDVFFIYTQSERVDNVLRVVDVFFMYTQSERVDKVVRVVGVFFMYTQS